jgi:hypothetical protein
LLRLVFRSTQLPKVRSVPHQPKILALPAVPEVAKMGRFSLTVAKTSEVWMPVSTIWLN